MIVHTLEGVIGILKEHADRVQHEVVSNPKIGDGQDDFRYKCGYAKGILEAVEIINKIIEGE